MLKFDYAPVTSSIVLLLAASKLIHEANDFIYLDRYFLILLCIKSLDELLFISYTYTYYDITLDGDVFLKLSKLLISLFLLDGVFTP